MPQIKVDYVKDSEGVPSEGTINVGGRILTFTYDFDSGLSINAPWSILPTARDILGLLFPFEPKVVLSLPDPLPVVSVVGGKTIFFDGLEGLLKWSGGAIDNTNAFNGSNCLKLTVTAPAGQQIIAHRKFPLPRSGKVGFSCVWGVDDFSKVNANGLNFDIFTYLAPDDEVSARVRYKRTTSTWQYLDQTNTLVDILNSTQPIQYDDHDNVSGAWHSFKLIVDIKNRMYVSLQVNNQFFDLSKKYCYTRTGVGGVNTETRARFWHYADAADELNVFHDDILVTEE